MLNTVIKLLELVLKALKDKSSPDAKRENLAKKVHKLYLDIDDAVVRGRRLLDLFGSEGAVINDAAIEALLAQQACLDSLSTHLREIEPILKIHFPSQVTDLNVAIEFKGIGIIFLLDWLLNSPKQQAGVRFSLPPGYEELTPLVRRLLLLERISQEELALEEQSDDPLNPWELLYERPISRYQLPNETMRRPILVATAEDVQKAERALDTIASIGEELRTFITEKFKLEDVL